MQIDVLGPASDVQRGGWTTTGFTTLWQVLDDNSDATYAAWSSGSPVASVNLDAHTPSAGHRRHLARVTLRGEDGLVNAAVILPGGDLTAPAALALPGTIGAASGSWWVGLPEVGTVTFGLYLLAQDAGLRVTQARVEIDSRVAPVFSVALLNGVGTPSTNITDTTQPTIVFQGQNLDGLPARQWRAWITQGASTVWDSGVVSGGANTVTPSPLPNGSLVLHAQVWSTLGADTPYPSQEVTLSFTQNVSPLPLPTGLEVSQVPGTPFFGVNACFDTSAADPDSAHIQVRRVNCVGEVEAVADEPVPMPRTGLTWIDYHTSTGGDFWTPYGAQDPDYAYGYGVVTNWWDGPVNDPLTSGMRRTVTGLTPGVEYTVRVGVSTLSTGGAPFVVGVDGIGWGTPAVPTLSEGWASTFVDFTFLADTVTHDVLVSRTTTESYDYVLWTFHLNEGDESWFVPAYRLAAGDYPNSPTWAASAEHANWSIFSGSTVSPYSPWGLWSNQYFYDFPDAVPYEIRRTISGLQVGRQYALVDATYLISSTEPRSQFGIVGGTVQSLTSITAGQRWEPQSINTITFTASAESITALFRYRRETFDEHRAIYLIPVSPPVGPTVQCVEVTDWTAPRSLPGDVCTSPGEPCLFHYQVRVVGTVSGLPAASGWANVSDVSYRWSGVANQSTSERVQDGLVVATNRALNPRAVSGGTAPNIGGPMTLGYGVAPPLGGFSTFARGTRTGTGAAAISFQTQAYTPGETVTVEATLRASISTNVEIRTTPAINSGTNNVTIATVSLVAGVPQTVRVTGLTPAASPASNPGIRFWQASGASGSTLDVTGLMVLGGTDLTTPYFDGTSTSDPLDLTLSWSPGDHLLRAMTPDGPVFHTACGQIEWSVTRPFTQSMGLNGTQQVSVGSVGGHDFSMNLAVRSQEELEVLEALMSRALILVSPADSVQQWSAPVSSSVQIVKVGRVRTMSASTIGTGPEPVV